MDHEEAMKQLRSLLKESKMIGKKIGITGTFHCPSCRQERDRTEGLCNANGGPPICNECHLDAFILKHHGYVTAVDDLVPKSEHSH